MDRIDHLRKAHSLPYFAVKLWQDLVGNTCYDSGIPVEMGKHVYCHSRDGKDSYVYLVINDSRAESTTVELPKDAVQYILGGNGDLRSTVMYLNGRPLVLGENDELPDLSGEAVAAGTVELTPGAFAFCTAVLMQKFRFRVTLSQK